MKRVQNHEKYLSLFECYSHSIAVIYSSLEGQYDGELYVNEENNPLFAILFTPFNFHFIVGDPEVVGVADLVDEMIFTRYLKDTNGKEAVIFSPETGWNDVLDNVFARHNGIKDLRKIYRLNIERFKEIQKEKAPIEGVERRLAYEQSYGARKKYPVCRVYKGNRCVSYCAGFMLGKDHAEIDVATEEGYHGQGYAMEASIGLISYLLESGIEPDWAAWPYRTGSQNLALSLGFQLEKEVSVNIWVEAECSEI
jgi:hypothetical protein